SDVCSSDLVRRHGQRRARLRRARAGARCGRLALGGAGRPPRADRAGGRAARARPRRPGRARLPRLPARPRGPRAHRVGGLRRAGRRTHARRRRGRRRRLDRASAGAFAMTADDRAALWLTFQLAAVSTAVLLLLGTPLAWWLARTRWRGRAIVE